MKAWCTSLHGVESIVFADTKGQAIAKTQRSAADAWGKENAKWTDIKAIRWPEYDHANEGTKVLATWACHSKEAVGSNGLGR